MSLQSMHTIEQLTSGELKGTKILKLSNQFEIFPKEIYQLADTLEILDLSNNQLAELPDDFASFTKLKIAFFSNNKFTTFPKVLFRCKNLEMIAFKANKISLIGEDAIPINIRWLILTDNVITALPKSIGNCKNLQKCMLAGNQLTELPDEFANCHNLQLLRISANKLNEFPIQLLSLSALAWLAFAGNPFCDFVISKTSIKEIPWKALEIKNQLGEGASGIISKAIWQLSNKEVAVKMFKGEVTSDGLPSDEMNASIAAGLHKHLVKVIGKIADHPHEKDGLVLELISDNFKNLGNPPDFNSCTRDKYAEGTSFSLNQITFISFQIASVCTHLHSKGILHGDLYAHNMLIDENANTLLGDFGAATLYKKDIPYAAFLERIEVRAFGYLLEDLLNIIDVESMNIESFKMLDKIKNECLKLEILERPDFKMILNSLPQAN